MELVEFSASFDIAGRKLGGTAHVFGERTVRMGELWEFDPHAFDKALQAGQVMAFYAHDKTKPLASQEGGTLQLGIVQRAGKFRLDYEMDLGSQSYANDLRENITNKLMGAMSFGVVFEQSEVQRGDDGKLVRRHTAANLYEVSPVAKASFEGTSATLYAAVTPQSMRERKIRALARAGGLQA